jgi:FecR-like protein
MASARDTGLEFLDALIRSRPTRQPRPRRRRVLMFGFVAVMLLGCDAQGLRGPGGSGRSAPAEVVARLTATSPDVRVERSGQSLTYTPNMLLRDGDRVRTGPATYAAIDFTDGNTVYMNHDTGVMLGSIRVLIGEIFNAIVRAGAGSEVYTNDLAAAAEGTMFLLRIDPLGTTVTVIDGSVRCAPTAGGAWHPFTLTANQQITGTARSYSRPTPVDARRAALWVNQVANRLKRRPPVLPQPRIN